VCCSRVLPKAAASTRKVCARAEQWYLGKNSPRSVGRREKKEAEGDRQGDERVGKIGV